MDILEHPTEWLLLDQALELTRKGLEEAKGHAVEGNHMEAALAFQAVIIGLQWQAMHQRTLSWSEGQ